MTDYERIVHHYTTATATATLSRATEQVAEEMAREFMKDPATRAELQALVRMFFGDAMQRLRAPKRKAKAKRRTKRHQ